jgi:putative ABC transport system permease protein
MEVRHMLSALWRTRTGPLLIAVQVAFALAVLVNVTYMIVQRLEAYRAPTGMDIDNIFWVSMTAYTPDYDQKTAQESDLQWLNSLPGVIAASASVTLPQVFWGIGLPFSASPDARAPNEGSRVYMMSARAVETLGLRLASGRTFSPAAVAPVSSDVGTALGKWAPEILITQPLADRLFPKGDALGKNLYVGLVNRSAKIVGIIQTMEGAPVMGPFAKWGRQSVIVPISPPGPNSLYLIRTQPGRQAEVMARVEKELVDRVPGRYVQQTKTLARTAYDTRNGLRSSSIILGVVTLLVLAVSAVGIFGLAVFNVTTRTKQIGTRRAIGARRFHILRYFLVENWLVTTSGVVVGCILALAGGVIMSHLAQAPRLPLYYLVGGVLFVWALGLSSVLLPARRAADISPAVATRTV